MKTLDEMIAELQGMELKLYMSNEELRDLNKSLNVCIATNNVDVVRALYNMLKLVQDSVEDVTKLQLKTFHASEALLRKGMFTPANLYSIKEDLEAVSQLHSKYKAETERLIEEGQIAVQRNAKLRIENLSLTDDVEARDCHINNLLSEIACLRSVPQV